MNSHFTMQNQRKNSASLSNLISGKKLLLPEESLNLRLFPQQNTNKNNSANSSPYSSPQQKFARTMQFKTDNRQLKSSLLGQLRRTWLNHKKEPIHINSTPKFDGIPRMKIQSKLKIRKSMGNLLKKQENLRIKQEQIKKEQKPKYLKKGTNIKRQVVTNLVRLKLGQKNRENDQENQHENIIKMVNLYKGYGQLNKYNLANQDKKKKSQGKKKKLEGSVEKQIRGWMNKSEEQYIEMLKHEF